MQLPANSTHSISPANFLGEGSWEEPPYPLHTLLFKVSNLADVRRGVSCEGTAVGIGDGQGAALECLDVDGEAWARSSFWRDFQEIAVGFFPGLGRDSVALAAMWPQSFVKMSGEAWARSSWEGTPQEIACGGCRGEGSECLREQMTRAG